MKSLFLVSALYFLFPFFLPTNLSLPKRRNIWIIISSGRQRLKTQGIRKISSSTGQTYLRKDPRRQTGSQLLSCKRRYRMVKLESQIYELEAIN